jgi:fused signal recognition particle receptor
MLHTWFNQWFGQSSSTTSLAQQTALLNTLEETLILADVSVELAISLVDGLRDNSSLTTPEAVKQAIITRCQAIMSAPYPTVITSDAAATEGCQAILLVGINGAGKTTTIGKLAHYYKQTHQHMVWIGAGDTYRAAAQEQLHIWSDRAGATVITGQSKDPAAVLFEALQQGQVAKAQTILLDTAGRLANQANLMQELVKIGASVRKAAWPTTRLERWLVLDATTGQNALEQVDKFNTALQLTGIILSKWDGTGKGGMVLSLGQAFPNIPVKWVGIGERLDDLEPFNSQHYLNKLFG